MEMNESCVPPGFRFHPTEQEFVGYYLRRKINSLRIDLNIIVHIDLHNMEPWDIQERCKLLGYEEHKEWYFFSHKDRKYPTGTRTNRATAHGFWKATGRDKTLPSKNKIIGMRKTLVFYRGRAPNGKKSDWIVHQYRLQTLEYAPSQEEGWVVCRAFKKPIPSDRLGYEAWAQIHSQTVNPTLARSKPFADSAIQNQDNLAFLYNSIAVHHALEALPPLLDSHCPTTSMNENYEITLMPVQKSFDLTAEDIDFDYDWKTLSGFLIPELMENNNGGSTSLLPWEI